MSVTDYFSIDYEELVDFSIDEDECFEFLGVTSDLLELLGLEYHSVYEDDILNFFHFIENEEPIPNNGLPKHLIDTLPVIEVNEGSCSICIENYQEKTQCITLPCQHYFHRKCITQWLLTQSTCPICRLSIAVPNV